MTRIEKPWGYEEIIEHNERYVFKRLFMRAGHSCSLQYHEVKHETVLVVDGELDLLQGNAPGDLTLTRMGPGDHVALQPGRIHRMTAVSDCTYVEASTPELEDVIRIQDSYGRA